MAESAYYSALLCWPPCFTKNGAHWPSSVPSIDSTYTAQWPVSPPALSDYSRDHLAEDGFKHKRRRTSSEATDDEKNFTSQILIADDRLNHLDRLPEAIVDIILSLVSFADQRRFRCVCRRWRRCLYQPLPCTVLSRLSNRNAMFYCNSANKWFSLPSNRSPIFGTKHFKVPPNWKPYCQMLWEVVDVEGGLVCYQCRVLGRFWLYICNPLISSLFRVVEPNYPSQCDAPHPPKVKLLVDRATSAFKVLMLMDITAVYDSITLRWQVYNSQPWWIGAPELFAWKNVIYAYNTRQDRGHRLEDSWVAAFHMESGRWMSLRVEIPYELGKSSSPTHHFFLSDNDEVMLVQYKHRTRPQPYVCVWKLLESGLDFSPIENSSYGKLEKWRRWEKVIIEPEDGVVNLAGHRLVQASFGAGYMCFAFGGNKGRLNGFKSYISLSYSFAARRWNSLECPMGWELQETFALYNWEPSLNIDPRFPKQGVDMPAVLTDEANGL